MKTNKVNQTFVRLVRASRIYFQGTKAPTFSCQLLGGRRMGGGRRKGGGRKGRWRRKEGEVGREERSGEEGMRKGGRKRKNNESPWADRRGGKWKEKEVNKKGGDGGGGGVALDCFGGRWRYVR